MSRIITPIIILFFAFPANASNIVSWYPPVIEHIYVNDTVSENIEYSVTTSEQMAQSRWTVDGQVVEGAVEGSVYYFDRIWDDRSRGFHIVSFNGNNGVDRVDFSWFVNIYEIGGNVEGSIFDVIDDSLDDHAIDIKTQMFRYGISSGDNISEFTSRKARQMQDAITERQMKREYLSTEFKGGNITFEEYVAAMKQVQKEARFYMKLSKELGNIARSQLNNEELGREFENFSLTEEDWAWHEGQVNNKNREQFTRSKRQ